MKKSRPHPEAGLTRIRLLLAAFIFCLAVSGLTAFPLAWELQLLAHWLGIPEGADPAQLQGLSQWICQVRNGLLDTYAKYPFIAYGTDWLAFAHLVLALLFIGPYRDPVKNLWVLEFGLWACALVLPLALIAGPLRGIPFYWQLIDCSFGVIGFLVLFPAWKMASRLAKATRRS